VSLLNSRLEGIERSADVQKSLTNEEISEVAKMVSGLRCELDAISLATANSDESFTERIADLHRSIDEFDQNVEDRLTSSSRAIGSIKKSLQKDYELLLHNLMEPTVQVSGKETVGTGVIIGSNGADHSSETKYILTAWHVIRDLFYDSENLSPEIEVQAYNTGKTKVVGTHSAYLVEYDADIDVALLRLRDLGSPLVGAKLPDFTTSEAGRVFQSVYAVGCPLGNNPVPTLGEILDIDHQVDGQKYWMISAPTYIGNSGGGVFDKKLTNFWEYLQKFILTGVCVRLSSLIWVLWHQWIKYISGWIGWDLPRLFQISNQNLGRMEAWLVTARILVQFPLRQRCRAKYSGIMIFPHFSEQIYH